MPTASFYNIGFLRIVRIYGILKYKIGYDALGDTRMDLAEVHRLFEYDRWANRQVTEALTNSPSAPPRSVRWMAHIVGAEALWLARLKHQPARLPVWPEFSTVDLLPQLDTVIRAWREFVDDLRDSIVQSKCEYVNSKGESFTSSVEDILKHVVMHSVYHRGQIAADMRAVGLEPVYTDFIHAARQGHLGAPNTVIRHRSFPENPCYLILFKPGPNWIAGKKVFEQPLRPHVEYMQKLYEERKLLYAGPFSDDSGGLAILRASSHAEAAQILAREPATSQKIFEAEIHPWFLTFDASVGRSLLGEKKDRTQL